MNNTIYYVASRGNGKGLTSLSHLCKLLENGYEVKAIKGGFNYGRGNQERQNNRRGMGQFK